ncbi:MAG TPA: acyl-CoA dehydrogenase [Blastocatellia bacterium]|jgi:alkylation response protein AidB-like acyl-CoA dehydrogenase|nr:acyl-CoA dehydrogenase [Blastocatellia bacterium]HCX31315.1 acyl-CoA dehydrogenase [Blastocatellia bacterium]
MTDKFIDQLPFFTPEHRTLAAGIESFVAREIETRAGEERDTEARLREYVSALATAGVLRYAVASPGTKLDVRALCLIREALSYSSALADLAFVMQGLGTYAISQAAPEHVRDFWISRAADGKSIAAFALTEPDAGSDVAAIKTTAQRDGDAYVLDGTKRFISNAGVADFYTVFARTGTDANGRAQLSAFVVGAKIPGFSVSERTTMIASHPIGELQFKGCRVPAEDMVGAEGDGFLLAMRTMDMFRASVGAAACGMARRALDEAVRYATSRKQFGRLLAEHQLIQEKLADMATELDAARLLVYRAAYLKDMGGVRVTREASEAKLYATEAACRIVDSAVQIHGGSGLVRGSVVERLYREIRALRIYEGTSEIQKLIIASQLLKE